MLASVTDLRSATEFERFALDAGSPPHTSSSTLDIRDANPGVTRVQAFSVAVLAQGDIDAVVERFRPLLFGAAWKCIDLALELGLHQAGIRPDRGSEYSIIRKCDEANHAQLPPLSADAMLWPRFVELYVQTSEVRHCLTHRTFGFNAAGDMTGMMDRTGRPVRDLSAVEQAAFVQVALLALQSIFAATSDARTRALLIYQLDLLKGVHNLGAIGGGKAKPVENAVLIAAQVLPDGTWQVDIDGARAALKKSWPSEPLANVRITPAGFNDNRPLVGRLEEAPAGHAVVFDPSNPPGWMRT